MTGTSQKRAVVADPDPQRRRILAGVVTAAGFEVVAEVATVTQALRRMAAARPALVVVTDGSLAPHPLEVVADLRQGDPPAEVIVVAGDEGARARALAAGASDLTALDDPDALAEAVAAVAGARAPEEHRRPRRPGHRP